MNYVLKSIEFMDKCGGFTLKLKDKTIEFYIDYDGNLVERFILNNGTSYKNIIDSNSYKSKGLVYLLEYTIFAREDKPVIEYMLSGADTNQRRSACNIMYIIYKAMMNEDRDILRQVITGNSFYSVITNSYRSNISREEDKDTGLLTSILDAKIASYKGNLFTGYTIYKSMNSASSLEENKSWADKWDSFCNFKDTSKDNQEKFNRNSDIDTSLLDSIRLVYEFIDEKAYLINPAVGRDKEIRNLGSTILTPSFSAMLVGEAGVGKTAIIEGLSYLVKNNALTNDLSKIKILKINASSIVSGCVLVGQVEKKMEFIIKFLRSNPNVILYMDELHTASGAGTGSNSNIDIVNMLKPYIEDGTVRMIGATTNKEYKEYLEQDSAFTSRFNITFVHELEKEPLKEVVYINIKKYEMMTGKKFLSDVLLDSIIDILVELTDISHRERVKLELKYNPRLILSIIQMSFGYARFDSEDEVSIKNIAEAIELCEYVSAPAKENALTKLNNLIPKEKVNSNVIEFKRYTSNL